LDPQAGPVLPLIDPFAADTSGADDFTIAAEVPYTAVGT
jgi:hypothetical protein